MFLFDIGFITFIKFGYPRVVYGDTGYTYELKVFFMIVYKIN